MIRYSTSLDGLTPERLDGFFVGWPAAPAPDRLLAALRGSHRVVVAVDGATGEVVGFVNAIGDGVLTAFVPWLEVRSGHQGRGIGSELLRRLLDELDGLYSVDLTCDESLTGYYEARGFARLRGMGRRDPAALRGDAPPAARGRPAAPGGPPPGRDPRA